MKSSLYFLILSLLIFLTACASYEDAPSLTPLATPSPIFLSPFDITAQSAQVDAQNTITSGQAIASNLNLTATAISLQQLQNNMALTQAAFTQQAQAQQTETAQADRATEQAAMVSTSDAQFTATHQAIVSATAWPQTATPLAATEIAIIAEATEIERRLYWSRYASPFLLLLGAIVLIAMIVGVIIAFRRLLPVWELRLRMTTSPDGETITYLPAGEEIKALMPGRSFGSAMHSGKEETTISGVASDPVLQDRVVARNQAIRLTAPLPPGRTPQQAQRLLNASNRSEEKEKPVFHILAPTERPPLLDGDTLDILEGKWSENHDN
ncbi:MAG: hypothetical protein DRN14_05795 [Thermoplasmata archaeon]|nr:MAG: hypothetical protein DRN14_05795 [Thermoplasmata archaeon]